MKQTRKKIRKIRKANIRRKTKKYNYRKKQRGGWSFFTRDPSKIKQIMTRLPRYDGEQPTDISFPFGNIDMDIIFSKKSLDGNLPGINSIPERYDLETFDYRTIPDVIKFITDEYTISQLWKDDSSNLFKDNIFEDGVLKPNPNTKYTSTFPQGVVHLIFIMKGLAREIGNNVIYINRRKRTVQVEKIGDSIEEAVSSQNNRDNIKDFPTTCKRYADILENVQSSYKTTGHHNPRLRNPNIDENQWNIYFFKILQSFLVAEFKIMYFTSFRKFIEDSSINNENLIIILSQVNPNISLEFIEKYKNKIDMLSDLQNIEETEKKGKLLQYVKNNLTTNITTTDTSIISKTNYISFLNLILEKYRIDNENIPINIILAAVIVTRTINFTKNTIEYSSRILWLFDQNTIDTMTGAGFTLPEVFSKNIDGVKLIEGTQLQKEEVREDVLREGEEERTTIYDNQIPTAAAIPILPEVSLREKHFENPNETGGKKNRTMKKSKKVKNQKKVK